MTATDGKFSPVEAIAIQGDSIVAVGSLADAQRDAGTSTPVQVLGKGQTIVPGFINPHLHLLFTALALDHESILNFSPSIVKRINNAHIIVQGALAKKKLGEWVVGFGYDPFLV